MDSPSESLTQDVLKYTVTRQVTTRGNRQLRQSKQLVTNLFLQTEPWWNFNRGRFLRRLKQAEGGVECVRAYRTSLAAAATGLGAYETSAVLILYFAVTYC